jgi:nucleotide-binding universal stress UspA family protein
LGRAAALRSRWTTETVGAIVPRVSPKLTSTESNRGLIMSTTSESQKSAPLSIVVGLDFSDAGGFAFGQAARIAQRVPGCELHLVHVFEEAPSEERRRQLVDQLRLYANEKVTTIGGLKGITIGIHLRAGKPVREIVQLVTELGAGLVVLGAHKGTHVKSWMVGSTAERLVASAPCPVLVAGPKPAAPEKHEPAIEPPCPDCARARAASHGADWWCERHAHHAKQAHTFSYQRELPFATHDSQVIPTGIKF